MRGTTETMGVMLKTVFDEDSGQFAQIVAPHPFDAQPGTTGQSSVVAAQALDHTVEQDRPTDEQNNPSAHAQRQGGNRISTKQEVHWRNTGP